MKKKWKTKRSRILISVSFLMIVFLLIPAVSFSRDIATVCCSHTEMFKKKNNDEVVGYLYTGMKVTVDRENDLMSQVTLGNTKGWVSNENLLMYSVDFSNVEAGVLLGDKILRQGTNDFIYYYFDEKLNLMNIRTLDVEETWDVGLVNEMYYGAESDIFLFGGTYTNNEGQQLYNYQVFAPDINEFVFIGSFDYSDAYLSEVSFSDSGQYLAMNFSFSGDDYSAVFDTSVGEMIGYVEGVKTTLWFENTIVMNDSERFWYINMDEDFIGYDIGFEESRKLIDIDGDWLTAGLVNSEIDGDVLYIATDDYTLSYNLISGELAETDLRGLFFNESQSLNFYIDGLKAVMKDLETDDTYSSFSGDSPKYEFIQFLGDRIIYRYRADMIDTMYVYQIDGDEDYEYKVIDLITSEGEDWIVAESIEDKGLYFIVIEIPLEERFYIKLLKGSD